MEFTNESTINPEEFLIWAQNNSKLYVNKSDSLIENCYVFDIVIKDRNQEEKIYLKDKEIFSKLRRGNCIICYKEDQHIYYKIARKGLIKFFDFHFDYTNQKINEREKTLGPVDRCFQNGKSVIVYLTEKANGENFQIAYEPRMDTWIIGSKNATILCRDRNDILFYSKATDGSNRRYNYCVKFAEFWFDLLEKEIKLKNHLHDFKRDITGYTIIGEIVGDSNHQHIKLYKEKRLIAFAVVRNDSELICLSLEESLLLLNKYGLEFVKFSKSSRIKGYTEFESYMKQAYTNISKLDVESGGEGSVAYISEIDDNPGIESAGKIISICKFKTFEYKFLRKIRDKIELHKKKKTLINPVSISEFEKECYRILKEEELILDITDRINFARFVFSFVKRSSDKCDFINKYATFINEIKLLFKSEKLLTDEIVKTVSQKYIAIENKDDQFKAGNIYFLSCLGLVAGGKSTLFSLIENLVEERYADIVNLSILSSDKIKADLVNNYLIQNTESSEEIAFEKTAESHKRQLKTELEYLIKNKRSHDKINIILVDKNFPADHINHFCKDVSKYLNKSEYEVVLFYPKIMFPLDSQKGLIFPFSWSYFIQCYHRLKLRKNHETLDFDKNSKAHYILLCFLNLHKNMKNLLYINENNSDISYFPITFHDEKEIQIPKEIILLFKEILIKTGRFDLKNMETIDNIIKIFFSHIEDNYPLNIFKDTRDQTKIEIENFLSLKFKINSK